MKSKTSQNGQNIPISTKTLNSDRFEKYSNEKPVPYKPPKESTSENKLNLSKSIIELSKETSGIERIESKHEKPSLPPSFSESIGKRL